MFKYLSLIDEKFNYTLKTYYYYLFSIIIASSYTLYIFPFNFFTGENAFWFDVRTDPTQHITGMWAFIADKWHFPLLKTTYLNYPQGVSVAFTDSIPIAAIIYKLIANFFPTNWHYFGVWVFLSYILQGIAGAFFLGEIIKKTILNSFAGTLFAIMAPSLMIRLPHSALLMQSLIIFALVFYYISLNDKISPKEATKKQSIILLIASLIHPYLVAMIYPIYFTTHLSLIIKKKIAIKYSFFEILSVTILILVSFFVVGYIVFDKGLPPAASGFEINSMNLLSPFLGTHLAGSYFLPSHLFKLDATTLQIDGHNYLGISILLVIFFVIFFRLKYLLKALYTHIFIVILMLLFTIYSLSTKVYLGDELIFSYHLPSIFEKITTTFRSSGRFFWPVGYILLFSSLLFLHTFKQKTTTLVLTLLVILQFIDTSPHRAYLYESSHRDKYYKVELHLWSNLVKSSNKIYLFPTYGCNSDYIDPLFVQYFASSQKKQYNSGFVARVRPNCKEKERVLDNNLSNKDLFIFSKDKFPKERVKKIIGDSFPNCCRIHNVGIVCQIGSNGDFWQKFDVNIFKKIDN